MTLAGTSAPWQQVAMPAIDLRRYLMTLVAQEGVRLNDDFKVSQRGAGANYSVDIAGGLALILGDDVAFQGPYYAYNDAVYNLTGFAAADSTHPRVDRVTLEVRDAATGGAANDWRFVIVTGTPTSGATLTNLTGAGAVGSNRILLANVLIPASATSITDANIDSRLSAVRPALASTGSGMEKIYDSTLTAAAASFDITGIPSTYAHLQLVTYLRSDDQTGTTTGWIRFNGDTGSNYRRNLGITAADDTKGFITGSNALVQSDATAGNFGVSRALIANYAVSSRWRQALIEYQAMLYDGTNDSAEQGGVLWKNTAAAINQITILPSAGSFAPGSRVTLYGLRA